MFDIVQGKIFGVSPQYQGIDLSYDPASRIMDAEFFMLVYSNNKHTNNKNSDRSRTGFMI